MSKNARIFTNSGFCLNRRANFHEFCGEHQKKGFRTQIYAIFYEFWGEATKTNGVFCKIFEKTVLAHEFWGDNQYFGSLRPRIALQ